MAKKKKRVSRKKGKKGRELEVSRRVVACMPAKVVKGAVRVGLLVADLFR